MAAAKETDAAVANIPAIGSSMCPRTGTSILISSGAEAVRVMVALHVIMSGRLSAAAPDSSVVAARGTDAVPVTTVGVTSSTTFHELANQAVHLTPRTSAAFRAILLGGASDLDR